MKSLALSDIAKYVEENIGAFHGKRIDSLQTLKLNQVLKRKNPYLFKAKHFLTAPDIVKSLVDAHISSSEEAIFGDFLEGLAIFICQTVYGGKKSAATGVDLEFDKDDIRYIVSIKSGPNWGNSGQIKKMIGNFNTAIKILKTSNSKINVNAVNGCCYGRDNHPYKVDGYYKLCGQRFWEFISGNEKLYTDLIEPLGHKAREKNEEFLESYAQMINKFTLEFSEQFCTPDGRIGWEAIVRLNSSL